ncbi:MAG: hypothetical protein JWR67_1529, partial [Mucilaginibacter sp.]|nr:hypothetical protein [Mucilaginibacter sp.]
MISCYVIDDEFHAIEALSDIITSTPGLELIGTTTNPLVGLDFITSGKAPELTFVDINMPQLSGIEFASLVNQLTKVIFTTAYHNYAVEAFEKEAFDYLLKPITPERFLKCITKYKKSKIIMEPSAEDHFYIKSEAKGKMVRININEIVYIEGALNYIIIHIADGKNQITYLTMGEIQSYLPEKTFSRIHRSFIINSDK